MDPGLPEAHLAVGLYHYWGLLDYKRALEECDIALAAEPNNRLLVSAVATIYKRTGEYAAAAERFGRASELDPLSPSAGLGGRVRTHHPATL